MLLACVVLREALLQQVFCHLAQFAASIVVGKHAIVEALPARAARLRRSRPRRIAAHGPPGVLEPRGDGGGDLPRPRGRRPLTALRGRLLLALLAQVLRRPDGGAPPRPLRVPRAARGDRGDGDRPAEDG